MSAAVTIKADDLEETQLTPAQLVDIERNRAVLARLKARNAGAVPVAPPRPIDSSNSNSEALKAMLQDHGLDLPADTAATSWFSDAACEARRVAYAQKYAEHRASCDAEFCDWCRRYACTVCRRVRVPDYDRPCRGCCVNEAIVEMGIRKRYADALQNLETRVSNRKARELAAKSLMAPKVVLKGLIGRGKTTLGAAMLIGRAGMLFDRGQRCAGARFIPAMELGLARSQHRLGAGEAELVEEAMTADLVLIDDLGAEGPRDVEVISAVIHARHDQDLGLWITTGLTAAEVGQRYGGGVERRLYEGAVLIDCGGPPK